VSGVSRVRKQPETPAWKSVFLILRENLANGKEIGASTEFFRPIEAACRRGTTGESIALAGNGRTDKSNPLVRA